MYSQNFIHHLQHNNNKYLNEKKDFHSKILFLCLILLFFQHFTHCQFKSRQCAYRNLFMEIINRCFYIVLPFWHRWQITNHHDLLLPIIDNPILTHTMVLIQLGFVDIILCGRCRRYNLNNPLRHKSGDTTESSRSSFFSSTKIGAKHN